MSLELVPFGFFATGTQAKRNLLRRVQTKTHFPEFNRTNICAVNPGEFGELLLGKTLPFPPFADGPSKGFAD
jgi:hypothetical protein